MRRLFRALSRTTDGAFIINEQHRIIFWNQAAQKILGYTAEEATRRLCYEILGGRDEQGRTFCQRYCLVFLRAERGDLLPNLDVYARTKTGQGRWLNVTTFAYPVADQTPAQVIVHLFRDATEKKNYQRIGDIIMATAERRQRDEAYGLMPMTPADSQASKLTARERHVLELLAQGVGTKEIADTLIISQSTVRNHVQNLLSKLGVHSRLEAIAYAYQQGWIDPNGR